MILTENLRIQKCRGTMKTVIVSLSAKNIHKSLAAWCLKAYCDGKNFCGVEIEEATVNNNIGEIIGRIYEAKPDVIAFSCYIWNIEYVNKIGKSIKKLLPEAVIILGGPEVSFEENTDNFPFADYIVRGAGEEAFYGLLCALERGSAEHGEIIDGGSGGFSGYPAPFNDKYFNSFSNNQLPIGNQLIYYESSRGCPFSCSYCLSSAARGVRFLDLKRVESDLNLLIKNGAKCVKFVDRTFNADKKRAKHILNFILNLDTDCTFHFEAAADLFDEELFSIIKKMPAGRIQFEIGIQSLNERTLAAVNRETDIEKALENICRLVEFENCHIHVDLIAGLPFETIDTFKQGINRCISVKPHMLQLGFLKMLKGTKMRRESEVFSAVFSDFAPYEVFKTDTLKVEDILELKRIESVIDKFYNSGAFKYSVDYAVSKLFDTPYNFFKELSRCFTDVLNLRMSMKNAYTVLLDFLSERGSRAEAEHYIKLDCLSSDSRGLLPDSIKQMRNKQAEINYKNRIGNKSANIRIEFFELENKYKLFDYDKKNALNRFEGRDIIVD